MNIQGTYNFSLSNLSRKEQSSNEGKSITLKNDSILNKPLYSSLEKTKEKLVKSKEELIARTDLPPEQKKEMLKSINEQIQEVEDQIQEAKLIEKEREQEKLKKKLEENQAKKEELKKETKDEVYGGVVVSESLQKLIEIRQSVNNIGTLRSTKAALELEKSWLPSYEDQNSYVSKMRIKLSAGIKGLENRINSETVKVFKDSTNTKTSETKNIDSNDKEEDNKEKGEKDKNINI